MRKEDAMIFPKFDSDGNPIKGSPNELPTDEDASSLLNPDNPVYLAREQQLAEEKKRVVKKLTAAEKAEINTMLTNSDTFLNAKADGRATTSDIYIEELRKKAGLPMSKGEDDIDFPFQESEPADDKIEENVA